MSTIEKAHRQRYAGQAMRDSASAETLSELFDVGMRQARRYRDGRNRNWLTEVAEKLESLHEGGVDVWRMGAHILSTIKRVSLRGMTTADLVERWHELTDLEHDLEAQENRAIAAWGGASEEIAADEREARIQLERAAVRLLLEARRVNPRDYRRER